MNEQELIQSVIGKLVAQGVIQGAPAAQTGGPVPAASTASGLAAGEPVTLPPLDEVKVDNPKNMAALEAMRKTTPARILMGRCGARQKTHSFLHFQADHAAAVDAVFLDVSDECLAENGLFGVQTVVKDKDEYLMKPELGKRLSEGAKKTLSERCDRGVQVQIVVVDGLSSTAIEANIADTVPALVQGLKAEGLSVGTPFFIKYGRVGVMDEVGALLGCDVVVELVGERPGLITAESMSAYMVYKAGEKTVEADRTIISNIHRGGTPPAEAGAHMATVVKQMLAHKASGVALSEAMKG
ncbi:ethanolamine ammonia-lyase subunit EutC [Desulfoluna spongiiphila]|uniref:Ethanolamine ammonia-lyase small subunit n=1 Tax=Desulfoluna spongiiphila TaxID=419481 RepID=A0A1G5D7E9_9BACT|nr:ethanolamine ammonia-lyase subunit EutC [Desulfoluna spongiiphila]SCY10458.1 Ethanolamine ammonia-lyase light chain [Desulfoluna spongiiphila]VVS91749.1 ethanolamine ammonia-lyase light chain [Desulfoluna spongiiphila]